MRRAPRPTYQTVVSLYRLDTDADMKRAEERLLRAGAAIDRTIDRTEEGWASFEVTSRLPRRQLLEALAASGAHI